MCSVTKVAVFWDKMLCILVEIHRHFREHASSIFFPTDRSSRFLQNRSNIYHTTWHHILEDSDLHSCHHNSFQSHLIITLICVCLQCRIRDQITNPPATSCPPTCPLHSVPLLLQDKPLVEQGEVLTVIREKQRFLAESNVWQFSSQINRCFIRNITVYEAVTVEVFNICRQNVRFSWLHVLRLWSFGGGTPYNLVDN